MNLLFPLAVSTLVAKTAVYSRLIEWSENMQAGLDYPAGWQGLTHRGFLKPPWLRALEFMFYGLGPAALLGSAAGAWGYGLLCILRLPMWYVRFTTGNGVWWVGPSSLQGKIIAFDMTGDPRPPHLRRHVLRAAILSLVLDVPWLVAWQAQACTLPLLS